MATAVSVIPLAYLLGSIPTAYIAGRLLKGIDVREVGDGRIGAAYSYRTLGLAGGIIVGIMDLSKGVIAVLLTQRLTDQVAIVLAAGLAVAVGHNWSIFMRFQGGKGALTTYGVLISLIFWQFLIGLSMGSLVYFFIRKSGLATGIVYGTLPVLLWIYGASTLVIVFPAFLSLPMLLKHHQMTRTSRKSSEAS